MTIARPVGTVRLLVMDGPSRPATAPPDDPVPSRPALVSVDGRVLRLVRTNPRTTWRLVRDRTGLSDLEA